MDEARLWKALEEVTDPELPISLVDLGMIYGVEARAEATVHVKMTFTAIGCPAMEMIIEDVRERLLQEPGVAEVEVEVVWDPPWSKERLTERGRTELLALGVGL